MSNLFRVRGYSYDPITIVCLNLVRANSAEESAQIADEYWQEGFDERMECAEFMVQAFDEPEDGIGIVMEPYGQEWRFIRNEDGDIVPEAAPAPLN